jgi:hypothetical protein
MLPAVSTRGLVERGRAGRRAPVIGLWVVAVLFGAACGGSGSSASTTTRLPARPATTARLEITAPAPNQVTGRDVNLVVQLANAHLAPPGLTGGILRGDRGHVHVSVDGQLVSMPYRLTDRLPPLAPGPHTVQAEFVASDHLPFSNRVVAAVTFRVR